MKKILLLTLFLQGLLMASTLFHISIKDVSVPVLFEEDKTLPIAYAKIVFSRAGYIEDGNETGISRMSFKVLGEGTEKLGNTAFAQKLDEKAIKFSSYNGFETAGIEISCLKEFLPYAAKLSAEVFKSPNLTEQTLKKLKIVAMSQIAKRHDDFDYVADNTLKQNLFSKTPLATDGLGDKKDVDAITLGHIKKFLATHAVLEKSMLVIGGDISENEAKEIAKTLLSPLPKGQKAQKLPFYEANDTAQTITKKRDTQQAYIYFGAPLHLNVTDTDAYKAKLASFILGSSGFGSRLMETIRVKNGLAYSAYSKYSLAKTYSYFNGYLQTKPENEQKAIALVQKTVDEFVKDGATQAELESAKRFLMGSEPLRNETLSQRLSRSFNEYYNGQPIGYHDKELELMNTVSLDELNAFIRAHAEITRMSFAIVTE